MTHLASCLGVVAPYYNLVLVIIVIALFLKLFKVGTKSANRPWKFLFIAILIFIVEEVFTILRHADIYHLPFFMNSIFEMAIISIFIYTILMQKEMLEKKEKKKPKKKR